ncbi:hypothetical protein M8009_12935 [Halomonas sp. ATCH28]|uniref:Uncharacterized protein n=1 Tax=Halomonas gemina TaxID=2945105 RepID=A0ABT0T2P3_9GAMM|nr:hypothetical protein [Halomonas gemina]MCL7941191.1 hypothetical protein [Halomonas gemina]
MRYDGIGMGGAGSAITILFLAALVAFMVLASLHKRWPRQVENFIGSLVGMAVGGFWLTVFTLIVVGISIPVAGALDLDRTGQMISWPVIAVALYMVGAKLK